MLSRVCGYCSHYNSNVWLPEACGEPLLAIRWSSTNSGVCAEDFLSVSCIGNDLPDSLRLMHWSARMVVGRCTRK